MKNKLSEEKKAKKRKNYYEKWEQYKKYRDERRVLKAEYDRKRRLEKLATIKAVNKAYYDKNKSELKYKERIKEYRNKNRDKINERERKNAKKRRHIIASKAAKKRAFKRNATPTWLTKEHLIEIQEYYTLAKELEWLFEGQKLHVDHIIPLVGKTVCGLHVPWNLQLLPAKQNLKKSNKLNQINASVNS